MTAFHRLPALLTGFVLGLSGLAQADDTEIFGSPRAPNVVMIADSSGSMEEYVPARREAYNSATSYPNACVVYNTETQYREETRTITEEDDDERCVSLKTINRVSYCRVSPKPPFRAENQTWFNSCDRTAAAGVCYIERSRLRVTRTRTETVQVPITVTTPVDLTANYYYIAPKGPDSGSYNAQSVQCQNSDEATRDANGENSLYVGPILKSRWDEAERAEVDQKGYYISGSYPNQWYVLSMNYRNWMLGNANELPRSKGELLKKVLAGEGATEGLIDSVNKVNLSLMRFGSNGRDGGYGGKVVHENTRIDNEWNATNTANNRSSLKQAVGNLRFDNSTPLTETLWESLLYFKGDTPRYGDTSVDAAKRSNGKYRTPLAESCDNNFVILLTDGQPTSDTGADELLDSTYKNGCSGSSSNSCLDNLAGQMRNTDFLTDNTANPLSRGTQNIAISTIGFDIDSQLLRDTATNGGGTYYTASSYGTLVTALEDALSDVVSVSASFAPAGITVNQANQLRHSEDLYFALFQSGRRYHWDGNLKKYRLASNGDVQGLNAAGTYVDAVASDNSFLPTVADRYAANRTVANVGSVDKGGAASRLPTGNATRTIYTDLTSAGADLADDTALVGLTDALLSGKGITDAQARNYGLGKDGDGARHQVLGDPLHSEPLLVHHSSTVSTVFMGTNDGFLHAVNASTGLERFSFLPSALFENLPRLTSTRPYANGRAYGMDGPITSYVIDNDKDGTIEPGGSNNDRVIVYAGMRRGGAAAINPASNSYYALDVTELSTPKLLFTLNNADTGLGQLAQTWSPPQVATFKRVSTTTTNGTTTTTGAALTALVLGGGYDPRYDGATEPTATGTPASGATPAEPGVYGNKIYLLNPTSGALLATLSTDYSVPSEPRILDLNGDGYADTIYAIDIQGNLYRWQLAAGETGFRNSSFTGGKLASLSGSGDQARRFFYAPEAALMKYNGSTFVTIVVGSGHREKPLGTTIQDGIFVVWDKSALGFGALPQSAVGYSQLTDVSNNVVAEGQEGSAMSAIATDDRGWRIMLSNGEKVLSSPLITGKRIMLTSYAPGQAVACSSIRGGGKFFALSQSDGRPSYDLDQPSNNDPNALTIADRSQDTGIAGINTPPSMVLPSEPESGPGQCEQFVLINNKTMCISEGERVQRTKWRRR